MGENVTCIFGREMSVLIQSHVFCDKTIFTMKFSVE